MKMLKKLAAVMMVAAMSLSFTACGNAAAADKDPVVAQVGDAKITKTDLDSAMARMDAQLMQYYGENFKENAQIVPMYNSVLDQNVQQLIGYEILVMKAKENEAFKVTKEDIDAQFTSLKANFSTEEEFNDRLKQTNMTIDKLKENIEKDLYYQKIVDDYKSKVQVTDAEIKDYYEANIANYTKGPGANIYHILVDSEEKANEVLKEYEAGTSFADLAAKYGTDGTKSTGGSLGYYPYDTQQLDQDFMAGVKKLGEGEVSKPVKTQFGWHLIKVDGIQKEEKVTPLDEVKDSIKQTLVDQKVNQTITDDVENWKKEYDIKTFADRYQLKVPEATEGAEGSTSDSAAGDASAQTDAAQSATSETTSK